jgi:putative SOS response-associated peptidase YedK
MGARRRASRCAQLKRSPAPGRASAGPPKTVIRTFTIMTTTPNTTLVELHDRMPVILERQDWRTWLGDAAAALHHTQG